MTRVTTLLLTAAVSIYAQRLPRFGDYKVPLYGGKPVPTNPPTPSDREMRCCAWVEDLEPINFGGKYRVTLDTCGSYCATVHIVDRTTGEHFNEGSYGYSYIAGSSPRRNLPHGPEYRIDSRLLIFHGCPGEENCGSYYFLMTPNGLKRLRYVPFGIRHEFN